MLSHNLLALAFSTKLTVAGVLALPVLAYAVIFFGPHFWTPKDRGGDIEKGLAIWVEPIRAMAWPWGERTVPKGLRAAGFRGQFIFWGWQTALQGLLVLPALWNRHLIEDQARRIAEFIAQRRKEIPDRPIHLMGYSAGGYVALRALELLPDNIKVNSAALLSAGFDARHDMTAALSHVEGPLVVSASLADFAILGAGTLIFGGLDGLHRASVGFLGCRGAGREKVVQIDWRPGMILDGCLGMHEWGLSARFIARYVAPALGIRPQ